MKQSKSSVRLWLTRVCAIVTALVFAAIGYGCAWHTFVRWWEPVAWSAVLGAASAGMLAGAAKTLMPCSRRGIALAVTGLWAAAIVYGCVMGANYYFADESSARTEEAVITGKHAEERTRYRRVGRGRSIPAGTYNVYYLRVRFANGAERDMPVGAGRYAKARDGRTERFTIEKGLLGFPVFRKGPAKSDTEEQGQ